MDSSLVTLIVMCVGFFVIAVVALVLYLRLQDELQRRNDVIAAYDAQYEAWKIEKQNMMAKEELEEIVPVPVNRQPYLAQPAPPLPVQETRSNGVMGKLKAVKATVLKAYRIPRPVHFGVFARYFGKLIRYCLSKLMRKQPSRTRPSPYMAPKPIEYYGVPTRGAASFNSPKPAGHVPQYTAASSPKRYVNTPPAVPPFISPDVYAPGGGAGSLLGGNGYPYPTAVKHFHSDRI
eukprot:TRINITY_DN911_c4_g1_i1.p1 TRINITY_DN911_c4_g1~~TRINITY_DN911_c4_g1_i1.p1  ORF type:complete len:234 (+),score=17.72 TRINITY_DN911_c4_g1_i1:21-722(+)